MEGGFYFAAIVTSTNLYSSISEQPMKLIQILKFIFHFVEDPLKMVFFKKAPPL